MDLVDYVGRYVDLKKSGFEWKGLCPFHYETTPSFTVSPKLQMFHCFGCGAHGNLEEFSNFVQQMQGKGDKHNFDPDESLLEGIKMVTRKKPKPSGEKTVIKSDQSFQELESYLRGRLIQHGSRVFRLENEVQCLKTLVSALRINLEKGNDDLSRVVELLNKPGKKPSKPKRRRGNR